MLWEYLLGETVIKASYIRTSVSLDGMACRPPPLSTEPGEQQVPGKCSCTPPPPRRRSPACLLVTTTEARVST